MNASQTSTALIAYQGRPTAEVEAILNQVVSSGTKVNYAQHNMDLILWIYESDQWREELLKDWMVEKLVAAEQNGRRAMRETCKAALKKINRSDDNCPIVIEKLTFNIFSHYMSTKKSKRSGGNLSATGYGGIRSALTHLYRMCGKEMDEEFRKDLSQFMSGMKRHVAAQKRDSGVNLDEGKKAMSFDVYRRMCKELYCSEGDDCIFAHAFLTMEWNLMARSDNCVNMHVQHIQWNTDCLVFYFGTSKSNQTGERSQDPWHVYANPEVPEICPVLAMAKYLFSSPDILTSNSKLFPGNHQYERFLKIFHRVINKHLSEFQSLGVEKGSLGGHSVRKGAITLVASGCTVSLPMASICLRACWSMGPIKDRYIHYEKAGDQFVGRTVTGLSSLSKEFAISPVHWDWTDAPFTSKEKMMALLEENVVRKKDVSSPTFELLQFLFASLCYHYTHLDENMHGRNRLRVSPIIIAAGREKRLRTFAVTNYPWSSTAYTPFATGVPPHVMLMSEIQTLKTSFQQQTITVIEGIREELNKRNVGGDSYRAECILEDIKKANDSFLIKLNRLSAPTERENNRDDQVEDDFFILDADAPLEEELAMVDNNGSGSGFVPGNGGNVGRGGEVEQLNISVPPVATVERTKGLMISWENCREGSILLTTSSFSFPSMTFPIMLTMWFCGDVSKNIPPYRILKAKDVMRLKGGKQKLSNMKSLVKNVIRAASIANRCDLVVRSWSPGKVLDLYRGVKHFFAFPTLLNGKGRRYDTISWKTYFNALMKRKGKLYGEQ